MQEEEKFSLSNDTYNTALKDCERLTSDKIKLEKELEKVKQTLAEREDYIKTLEKMNRSLNKQMQELCSSIQTNDA